MNRRTFFLMALILTLALGAGAGCAKKPVGSAPTGDASATQGQGGMSEAELAAKNLEQAKRVIMSEKIYFAFDSFALTPQSQETLNRKAEVLNANRSLKVLVEGHTDERGTEEYNLALGERRAQAAYKYLTLLGVGANQLETISYGEERPENPAHNEQAWAQNRRCEFRLVW